MGLKFPITKVDKRLILDIPERNVPAVRPVEIPERVMMTAETYVYGGGGIITVDDIKIPRTGIWGRLPIPISPRLTHFRKSPRAKWVYIEEEPMIIAGFWRAGFWRASIPIGIRRKYRIMPDMQVQLVFTERVPAWLVTVYNMGETYTGRWYPRLHIVRWEIPKDNPCYNIVLKGFKFGIPMCDCDLAGSEIWAEFIFPGFERELIKEGRGGYRCSAVINIVLVDKKYEFKCDIRTQFLSVCPRLTYLDPNGKRIPLTECLAWTNKNLLDGHMDLLGVSRGTETGVDLVRTNRKGNKFKITRLTAPLFPGGKITKEKRKLEDYQGIENEPISVGETYDLETGEPYRFDYAVKTIEYLRATYSNADIESKIPNKWIWMDNMGFIWWRRRV